jgi:predicted Zn-dependent protease
MKQLILIIGFIFLTACATSPTGRSQLVFMPDAQVNQMGLQAFEQLKQKKPLSRNPRYIRFADCVANALTRIVGGNWEVVVFEDKTLNAFALPGNKIGIHSGLIEFVDNADQLAAVVGHEIGHVLARHSNERLSEKMAVNTGVKLISAVASPSTPLGQTAVGLLGVGAQYGILLPFSRTHESEADVIGLELMAKAGFNPSQSIVLWQKMAAANSGPRPPEILSTHPAPASRIENLKEQLPKAISLWQQARASGYRPNCQK